MGWHLVIESGSGLPLPEEIVRNITVLFGTTPGEQNTDREFGISREAIDKPWPVARQMIIMEVTTKIHRYEPRARVVMVNVEQDNEGNLLRGQMNVTAVIEVDGVTNAGGGVYGDSAWTGAGTGIYADRGEF